MASTALARVTGQVLAINSRKGTSHKTGSPVPWKITTVNILVASQNVTVVQLPKEDDYGAYPDLKSGGPVVGEVVDYLCEFSIFGQEVQSRALSEFPAEFAALASV